MINQSPEENKPESTSINEENLLTKIWFSPTATLTYILKNCPQKYVLVLFALGGIVRSVERGIDKEMGEKMSTFGVLGFAFVLGGLFGWITYYLYAWAISVSGNWMSGQAEPAALRTVIAWALVPTVCSLTLLIPQLFLFGDDLFRADALDMTFETSSLHFFFAILKISLSIWSVVILVKGISLVQNFGIGKSILNMMFPGLFVMVPLLLFFFVLGQLK